MKIVALLITALVVLFVARLVFQNMSEPTHLGHKAGQLAAMPDKPNAVSSQTDIVDKRVESLAFKGDAAQTMHLVLSVLSEMGGNELQVKESHYLHSVFTSSKLRFHDDVEVLLDEQAKRVHFRSQSRAGHSDLGVNRQRYEQFKALYNK